MAFKVMSVVEREVLRAITRLGQFEDRLQERGSSVPASSGVTSTVAPSGSFASGGSTTTPFLTVPL
jgi:hypothetical protein